MSVLAVVAVAGCNRRDPAVLSRPPVSRNVPGSKVCWTVGLTGRRDLVIDAERSRSVNGRQIERSDHEAVGP